VRKDNKKSTNRLDFTIDLSAHQNDNNISLSFDRADHKDEDHQQDVVKIRGSENDTWFAIYDRQAHDIGDGIYQTVSDLDIDEALAAHGQVPTSTFGIRFQQRDNYPAISTTRKDGLSIDNVKILASGGG